MTTPWAILVSCVFSGIFCFFFLFLGLTLALQLLGEENFAEAGGLEPIPIVMVCTFAGAAYPFLAERYGYALAALWFVVVGILSVAYGLLYLKLLGWGNNKKEFALREGAIVHLKDNRELHPTFVREDTSMYQSDAFHYSTFYFLELCDANGPLARNGYLSEELQRNDLRLVLEAARDVPCRALDLMFVQRKSEFLWWELRVSQKQAAFLCGPLDKLSEEERSWWRGWLRPEFPGYGYASISTGELQLHYEALMRAYGEILVPLLPVTVEELERRKKAYSEKLAKQHTQEDFEEYCRISQEYSNIQGNTWTQLKLFFEREEYPVEIMTSQRYETEVKKVASNGASLIHNSFYETGDHQLVKIDPR